MSDERIPGDDAEGNYVSGRDEEPEGDYVSGREETPEGDYVTEAQGAPEHPGEYTDSELPLDAEQPE